MSVVACRVDGGRIEISADSIVVRGYTQDKMPVNTGKLFALNGLIIGSVGLGSEHGMMQIFATTHKPAAPSCDAILSFLAEFAEWKKKLTDKYGIENQFLIAYQGHAFRSADLFINEIFDYDAIGAGEDYALAALYLGHDTVKAVETACELCIYCEKPIKTLTM